MNRYRSVKYTENKWLIIQTLAAKLSEKRGVKISLSDASTEAAKKMLEDIE